MTERLRSGLAATAAVTAGLIFGTVLGILVIWWLL